MFVFLTSCFSTTRAQQTNSPSKEADEALRQKAFDLLDSLSGQLSILQSPENRARLASNIVESIWEHDEKRARALVVSVQEDINTGLRQTEGDPNSDTHRRMVFQQLRINTIERIAKHDPDMAMAFFKNTEPPLPAEMSGDSDDARNYRDWLVREERQFEISLAQQIADNSPEVALSIARRGLAKDFSFSFDLIGVLRQLKRKHPDQAQVFFNEIVDRLKQVDLHQDQNAFYFAQNLIRWSAPSAGNNGSFRELANLLIDTAERNGCNKKLDEEDVRTYFCREIGQLLPLFNKANVGVGRSAGLKQWQSEESEESPFNWQELNEADESGSIDDLLALAAKYPAMRGTIYERAFMKAQMNGDRDRARAIVEQTPDSMERKSMLEILESQDKFVAAFKESLKDIDKTLDALKGMDQKFDFLLRAASTIGLTDRKEAVKLLDRTNSLVDTMRPGGEQLNMQIVLAVSYSIFNSNRGIVMIESLIPRLNELVGAAAKLDGYESHHLRDGEWNMSAEGPLGMLLTHMSQSASYFAWCDFDRAVSVAGQFERPELRLMAQLKLAQGILAGRPKPPSAPPAAMGLIY